METVSDWEDVKKAKEESSDYLKVEPGENNAVRVKIIQGPLSFLSYFDQKNQRGYNFPKGTQLPGYNLKKKYAFEVVLLEGANAGKHKVLECGQQLAECFETILKDWEDFSKTDVKISKEGSKLTTKWKGTAVRNTEVSPEWLKPVMLLREKIKWASKEDVDKLPPPAETKEKDALGSVISPAQYEMIGNLATQKQVTVGQVEAMTKRKFEITDLHQLSKGQASEIIEILKNM